MNKTLKLEGILTTEFFTCDVFTKGWEVYKYFGNFPVNCAIRKNIIVMLHQGHGVVADATGGIISPVKELFPSVNTNKLGNCDTRGKISPWKKFP